jgi:hypothetical protein
MRTFLFIQTQIASNITLYLVLIIGFAAVLIITILLIYKYSPLLSSKRKLEEWKRKEEKYNKLSDEQIDNLRSQERKKDSGIYRIEDAVTQVGLEFTKGNIVFHFNYLGIGDKKTDKFFKNKLGDAFIDSIIPPTNVSTILNTSPDKSVFISLRLKGVYGKPDLEKMFSKIKGFKSVSSVHYLYKREFLY